jgi:ABC-type nitrate/sulfonate/bicarbonate transport system ATPase subunit
MADAVGIRDLRFMAAGESILDGIDLQVPQGQLLCILGPSGAGKTTVLRLLGGLMTGATGEITIFDESAERGWKRLAFVFQTPRLVRWRSALDNVVLANELRHGRGRKDARRRHALDCLARVGVEHLADRPAHLLSGGEQQRVAIARALAVEPDVLLMDEPFSALDIRTRAQLRRDLVEWWREDGELTVIFVTHDVEEALALGSRAVVLSSKPTRVAADIAIDLPHPRDPNAPACGEHRRQILRHLENDISDAERTTECTPR